MSGEGLQASPARIRNAGHTAIALRDLMRAAPAIFDMLTEEELRQLRAAALTLEARLTTEIEAAATRPPDQDRAIEQARR